MTSYRIVFCIQKEQIGIVRRTKNTRRAQWTGIVFD